MLPLYAAWRGWKPIDGGPQERCEQIQISHYAPAVPPYTQCLRPYSDLLSDHVRREKRWMDCDALLGVWHSATHLGGEKSSQSRRKPLYVDAGANIGSCKTPATLNHALPRGWPGGHCHPRRATVPPLAPSRALTLTQRANPNPNPNPNPNTPLGTLMMLGLGIDTIAFEPLPANLFYLTSAVLANKPAFRAHLTLHPIALGAASGTIPLYSQRGNAGNTVVNAPVGDSQADEAAMVHAGAVAQILVSTLDSQMWPDSTAPAPRIALLKMDVQGYECRLLAGAQRLLAARAIRTVKLEVAPRWLRKQGCSAMELYTKLRGAGFHLWTKPGGSEAEVLTTSSVGGPPTHAYRLRATAADFRRLDANAQHYLSNQDFVATLPRAGAKAAGAKSRVLAKVSARARDLAKQRQRAKQMGRTKSIHSEGRGKKERTQ